MLRGRRARADAALRRKRPRPRERPGREVHTTQPGLQLYTGNKLNRSVAGRRGVIYRQSAGFAFESQGFPDAPHHPAFPSTILRSGEQHSAIIRYRFMAG